MRYQWRTVPPQPSILEDAIHLSRRFVEQGFGLPLAEQNANDGLAERGGQLVRFRMEVSGRDWLGEHGLGGLIVGPRLHVVALEVGRPDRKYPLHLVVIHVVLGIADESH